MDHLTDKLKLLQNIVPNDDFVLSTKLSIIAYPKSPSYSRAKFTIPALGLWVSSAAMAVMVVVAVLISNMGPSNITTSVAEMVALEENATTFKKDINITLDEIRAFQTSAEHTALILYEVSANGLPVVTSRATETEERLNIVSPHSNQEQVHRLLEQAIL